MFRFLTRLRSKSTIALLLVSTSLLSGCFEPAPPADPPTASTASRFLHRATFGPNQADIDRLVSLGWEAWMEEQFAMPLTDSHYEYFSRGGKPGCDTCDMSDFAALTSSFWYQTLEGKDQLRQRVAFALSELIVVSETASGELKSNPDGLAAFHDVLYQNAFGNFRVLLEAVSTHPSMGAMLSHKQNDKEDAVTGRLPDENYAREIMQLFSIGKWMLNNDGTRVKDANGNDIPSYNQNDIMGMAKALSGWSWGGSDTSDDRWYGYPVAQTGGENPRVWNVPMQAYSNHHSVSEKQIVTGVVIPAGTDAATSLRIALDTLFSHPNAGPFVATHLIKRLVTSNPTPAYVGRVAAVFNSDKNGARGNLRAVVRAVLFDTEAHDVAIRTGPTWGKLREPVIRMANYLRAFSAKSGWGTYTISGTAPGEYHIAQTPWLSPTVFNFFMPDHQPLGELSDQNLTAPEFQIFNETTSAGYVNLMSSSIDAGFGTSGNPINPNFSAELALASTPSALVDRVALLLNAGDISTETRAGIETALNSVAVGSTSWQLKRVKMAAALLMSSPDYLVQK
jgi:uncharacterized protein (DUF1800 family)